MSEIPHCLLLRHAESTDTFRNVVSGWRDVELTPHGCAQAASVAFQLPRFGVREVVSSDLKRAKETAEIIARTLGLPNPRDDARLRERFWGSREGLPHGSGTANDGEETEASLRSRLLAAIADVLPGTLVVTHAGPIRCLLGIASGSGGKIAPADFHVYGEPAPCPDTTPVQWPVVGHVLTPGEFRGRAIYVSGERDLARLSPGDVAFLESCPKAVAFRAINLAAAAINLTRSLTQHLTHGRAAPRPYAVATHWPGGFPSDGTLVDLRISSPPACPDRALFPDVAPMPVRDVEDIGGKAAGLRLLEKHGFRVPGYAVLENFDLCRWEVEGNPGTFISAWYADRFPSVDPGSLWAVRSSADCEDADGQPMSGTFDSFLSIPASGIAAAVAQIRAGAFGDEVEIRMGTGTLNSRPRISAIVQRMVSSPRLAGTVFVPAPHDPTCLIVEAQIGKTADELMDGRSQPDLIATFDRDGKFCGESSPGTHDIACLAQVVREALEIYAQTGRGDLEFAVDASDAIWWLQARMLNAAVEIVDRRGFAPAAAAYYKRLAFAVSTANCTPQTFFRCFDLPDGRFGYSVGIRQRDHCFHELVRSDPGHLESVIQFGWSMEKKMAEMGACLASHPCEEILGTLILHGAVQLPFSIPMAGSAMDRFRSEPVDVPAESGILERFLESILPFFPQGLTVPGLRDSLRQPERTFSSMHSARVLLGLVRNERALTLDSAIDFIAPELRDLPDLSAQGQMEHFTRLRELLELNRSNDTGGSLLAEELLAFDGRCKDLARERDSFLKSARQSLPPDACKHLDLWARYLQMKAETNETHALYRGRCFAHFARCGFSPANQLPLEAASTDTTSVQ